MISTDSNHFDALLFLPSRAEAHSVREETCILRRYSQLSWIHVVLMQYYGRNGNAKVLVDKFFLFCFLISKKKLNDFISANIERN